MRLLERGRRLDLGVRFPSLGFGWRACGRWWTRVVFWVLGMSCFSAALLAIVHVL